MSAIAQAMLAAKQVHYLVVLDFGGLVKRSAMRDLSVPYSSGNPVFFDGDLIEEVSISSKFDFRSWNYSARSISIKLANKSRIQDYEVQVKLDGGTGSVYVWAPGLDWADIENDGLIFRGMISLERYDGYTIEFTLSDFAEQRWKIIPETTINADTWPLARTAGGAGSVMGLPQPLIFGEWYGGIPLRCIDATNYKYLACFGLTASADADYTAGTVDVYDKDGNVIDPAGYVFYPGGLDGKGNLISCFDFTSDQESSEPLSCSIKGYADGSGELTGTAGLLLEHPGDLCYYLMKHHSLLAPNEIHVESLKTLKVLLSGLIFASVINRQVSGFDVMNRILAQCSASLITIGGKVGIVTLVTDGPSIGSIRWDHHVIGKGAGVSKTPMDDVINRVHCKYSLNPDNGKWEGEFTRDRTNDEACRQSYLDYGERPEYTLELADVRHELTARALAARLISLKSQRHDLIEIEVPIWDGFDFREGDAALLTVREGANLFAAGWMDENCVLIERTFRRHTIRQKWWRIAAATSLKEPHYLKIGEDYLTIGGEKLKL